MKKPAVSKVGFGLIGAACVACCAIPLAALLGFGGATGSMVAWASQAKLETILCFGALGALAAGGVYWYLKTRALKRKGACEPACDIDADCCNGRNSSSESNPT
jgi:hypothetical protein